MERAPIGPERPDACLVSEASQLSLSRGSGCVRRRDGTVAFACRSDSDLLYDCCCPQQGREWWQSTRSHPCGLSHESVREAPELSSLTAAHGGGSGQVEQRVPESRDVLRHPRLHAWTASVWPLGVCALASRRSGGRLVRPRAQPACCCCCCCSSSSRRSRQRVA